jgi:hypothetical protein
MIGADGYGRVTLNMAPAAPFVRNLFGDAKIAGISLLQISHPRQLKNTAIQAATLH